MKNRRIHLFLFSIFAIMAFVFSACQQSNEKKDVPKFAIYKVTEDTKQYADSFGSFDGKKYINGEKIDLGKIKYEETPIVTDKDIKKYNWKTHTIEFTQDYLKNVNKKEENLFSGGCQLFNAKEFDIFVVVVNGKKIYTGGYPLSPIRSQGRPEIVIEDNSEGSIIVKNIRTADDMRSSKEIYDVLKEMDKIEQ